MLQLAEMKDDKHGLVLYECGVWKFRSIQDNSWIANGWQYSRLLPDMRKRLCSLYNVRYITTEPYVVSPSFDLKYKIMPFNIVSTFD